MSDEFGERVEDLTSMLRPPEVVDCVPASLSEAEEVLIDGLRSQLSDADLVEDLEDELQGYVKELGNIRKTARDEALFLEGYLVAESGPRYSDHPLGRVLMALREIAGDQSGGA